MAAFEGAVSSNFKNTSPARFYGDTQDREKIGGIIGESGVQFENEDPLKSHQSPNFTVAGDGKSIF